jgi:aryl-alcohol dehydrogenase-like predicted oxidoreductase
VTLSTPLTCSLPRRPLGRSGLSVSPLALAAWSVGNAGRRGTALTPDLVERAYYEHGVNTFLFHFFMRPMVEGLRRLIRAGHRDDLVLIAGATIPTAWFVRWSWERHARALGVDCIDIFLLGWVQARWYLSGGTWPAMEALRAGQQVRAIGFSSHNRRLAARLARERHPDVLMIRYNAAHRGAEDEVFDTLESPRLGVLAYTATRWGMLLQPLPALGYTSGMAPGECYRFALGHPSVDAVLCAASTPEELREDVTAALQGPLPSNRLAEVRRFGDAVHAAARRGRRWMFE